MLKAALAMPDSLADKVFPADLRSRLRRTVTLVDRPARAQLLITGWGAPVMDPAYLDGTPALRAVFHTGGSVKQLVTAATFARGIVVSSAARANARPVAEFTVAAVVVVNTARGRLLDHAALAAECAAGRLDAVLDVADPLPLPPAHPLWRMPNVFLTPHIAGSQGTELRRLGEFALAEIERYLAGAPLCGQVRAEDLARVA